MSIHIVYRNAPTAPPINIKYHTFSGGEPHLSHNGALWPRRDGYIIDARIDSAEEMIRLLLTADFLRRRGGNQAVPIHLFIPYFPGARQDHGNPLTVKVYADMINAAGFASVTIVDPHSDVTPAVLERCHVLSNQKIFECREVVFGQPFCNDRYVGVISPDQGASKRNAWMGGAQVHGTKWRDATGQIVKYEAPVVMTNGHWLVADDICDGGATFIALAQDIRAKHSNVTLDLYVTHGIFAAGLDRLFEHYNTIFTTDSFPTKVDRAHPQLVTAKLFPLYCYTFL